MKKVIITSTSSHNNTYHVTLNIHPSWKNYWLKKEFNTPFYQALADNIINIPYVDMGHYVMEVNPVTIYRPNHDVGHSLRQAATTQFLLKTIAIAGLPEIKDALQHLTDEEKEAVMLAAFLFRAGRTNEHGGINDPSNAERSALLFTEIGKAVGFNEALVDNIAFNMCHHVPIIDEELAKSIPYQGYQGNESLQINKSRLVKAVLDLSHHSDLVRCWGNIDKINKTNLENLSGLLQLDYVKKSNEVLLDFARASNAITGTSYFKHDGTYDRFIPPLHLRKKAVTKVGETFADLLMVMNQFLPYIKTKDVEKSKKSLLDIEQGVNKENREDTAANTIKRAFRIRRAHKMTQQAVGIIPVKVSESNLNHLKQELTLGQGLSDKDKKRLDGQVLLPEEGALYNYLINEFDWVLKHITPGLSAIQENGNALKSLHQRNRESRANDARFTSDFEGRSDNIYFTLSSPNGWPAEFLQLAAGHEIRVHLRDFLNESGQLSDKLSGLWVSSAWYV